MSLNHLCSKNSMHWLKVERPLVSGHSTVMTPMWSLSMWLAWSQDHVSLSGCITLAAWHATGRLTCLMPRQGNVTPAAWHVTGRLTCPADSLAWRHFSTPNCSTNAVLEGLCREACAWRTWVRIPCAARTRCTHLKWKDPWSQVFLQHLQISCGKRELRH